MKAPNWLAVLARVVLVVAIPVILLFSSLYLFATPAFVRHEYAGQGFPLSRRFNPQERLRLSGTILNYVWGRESFQNLVSLRTDSGEIALRPEEARHLSDVRGVMGGILVAHGTALVLALGCLAALWRSTRRWHLPAYVRQGVWVTVGVIAFIGVMALTNFSVFFTRFHQLFFSPGTWTFFESDTLIQLYPLRFWMDTVWKMGLVIALEIGLVYGLSFALERWPRVREPEQ